MADPTDKLSINKQLQQTRQDMGLNEMQEAFARLVVENGGNGKEAAIAAGYSKKTAQVLASQLKQHPDVAKRIAQIQREVIGFDLGNLALKTVSDLMTSPKTPAAVKLGAARTALAAAGLDKPTEAKLLENKDLSEMDLSELQEFIKAGSKRLGQMRRSNLVEMSDADYKVIKD